MRDDDSPCPSCGISYDDLPVGHDLITPSDGSPQTCKVHPPADRDLIERWLRGDSGYFEVERDEDGSPVGMSLLAMPAEHAGEVYAFRPMLPSSALSYSLRPEPPIYGTPVLPTTIIPFESRDEAAAKVLAVLQEQKPQARERRLR